MRTVTTPGQTVDVVATEMGLTVNPARTDLFERFEAAGLPVLPMDELLARAADLATYPVLPRREGRTVAVLE